MKYGRAIHYINKKITITKIKRIKRERKKLDYIENFKLKILKEFYLVSFSPTPKNCKKKKKTALNDSFIRYIYIYRYLFFLEK